MDALLLCQGPEVLIDVFHEAHDVGLPQVQLQVARGDLAELHELVDEPQQALCAALGGLQGCSVALQFVDGTLDDGQGRTELMGDVGEQLYAELGELSFELHLLVQVELLLPVAIQIPAYQGR